MAASQRKVVWLRPGESDGRADLHEIERNQERRVIDLCSAKERKKLNSKIRNTNRLSAAWEISGNVIRLLRDKLHALPDFGKEVDPFELGTPEAVVRYFVNEDEKGVSESILELYEDIFDQNYNRFFSQDIVGDILTGKNKASEFSPSEVIAAFFAEEMRERFLAELRPSIEARFFENFSHQYPQAGIVMGSVWDNYRHMIHGISEQTAKNDLIYSHFIIQDDDVASVISDFSANGVQSIPGRAQKLLERPEKQFIEARHSVIRSSLHEVVARYDQLAETTRVSLSDRLWKSPSQQDVHKALFLEKRTQKAFTDPGSMRAFVEQLRDAQEYDGGKDDERRVERQVSAQWRPKKVGWLERFKPRLGSAFYDFCKHRNINARQLAHCVGTIAHYDESQIVRVCEAVAAALPFDGRQGVRSWRSALLAMADDRASKPSKFIENWQAIFGVEPECTAEEIAELQDNIIALLALDYCFRHVFSEGMNAGGILDDISTVEDILGSVQNAVKRLRQREVFPLPALQTYDETVNVALSLSRHMRDALAKGLVLKITDDKKISKILNLFDNSRIIGVLSLSVFGEIIRDKEHNEQIIFVRRILERSLHPVFDEVKIAKEDRSALIEDFTERLLAKHIATDQKLSSGSWVKRVVKGQQDVPPIPEKAPAFWKQDKQKGDTPVSFIQRHYGEWLGKGLSRPDVKRLDEPLYRALYSWLRSNDLPDGFDLPTAKEANDRLLASEVIPRDQVSRVASAAARRR